MSSGDLGEQIGGVIGKHVEKVVKNIHKKSDEKINKVKKYRQEASRLSSMANKRLARLEKAGLIDSPAYKKWADSGGVKFGVRGKSYNEVQQEVARLNRFLNAETSTIRGVNTVLKDMAKNTGINYKSLADLRQKAGKFFELSSKVEQYLRTVDDMASSIGYQKIWQAVNEYVQREKIDLASGTNDIDRMVNEVVKAMKVFDEKIDMQGTGATGWFRLPKN